MDRFALVFTVLSLLIFGNSHLVFGQADSIYRLPAGTRINLKLDAEISSKVSSVDDTFLATVTKPVRIRETTVLPAGVVLEGRVVGVERASGGGQGGNLDIRFETLKLPGEIRRIEGMMVTPPPERSSKLFSVLSVVGGIAAGALLGAVSQTDNGALLGAGIGAAAGTSVALIHKGKDVRIRKDQEFEIELKREVLLPVPDY